MNLLPTKTNLYITAEGASQDAAFSLASCRISDNPTRRFCNAILHLNFLRGKLKRGERPQEQ